jgi:hypothetical protein
MKLRFNTFKAKTLPTVVSMPCDWILKTRGTICSKHQQIDLLVKAGCGHSTILQFILACQILALMFQ